MDIQRLDHLVILCPNIDEAIAHYQALLGRACSWQHSNEADGTTSALFVLENTSIELIAPNGDGPVGERVRELLDGKPGLLSSLAFGVSDIHDAHYVARRRGLRPGDIEVLSASHKERERQWARFRCDDQALGGLKVFMFQERTAPLEVAEAGPGHAFRLDHLVVNTGNTERALANYGARLGLRLALERIAEKWGIHYLFFRLSNLTFEVIKRLENPAPESAPDSLWGLTWEVDDLDEAHARLSAAGVTVSDVRVGRKPGTRVMSIKSHDLGIPTLLLDNKAQPDVD